MESMKNKKKKGVVTDYLVWIIIGLAVLSILFVEIFIFRKNGTSLIDKIMDIFRS
jgi:hypothetical protein